MSEEGMGRSLWRAVKWHWNLLALGSGAALAVISGVPLGVLALVGAAELAYLGFLGLNPRFQAVLRGLKSKRETASPEPSAQLQQLLAFLTPSDFQRFEALRRRCANLLDLRRHLEAKDPALTAEKFRGESLDQMLWLFLKLLHQKAGLERFLSSTSRESIEQELERSRREHADALARQAGGEQGPEGRLATAIRERITTIEQRIENHRKAADNRELLCAEIDKTEQEINHLCEIGMTMRDGAELSAQVASISSSLQSSERIFADTAAIDLLDDAKVPPLIGTRDTIERDSAMPPPVPRGRVKQ
jgi:hypothetical protein